MNKTITLLLTYKRTIVKSLYHTQTYNVERWFWIYQLYLVERLSLLSGGVSVVTTGGTLGSGDVSVVTKGGTLGSCDVGVVTTGGTLGSCDVGVVTQEERWVPVMLVWLP